MRGQVTAMAPKTAPTRRDTLKTLTAAGALLALGPLGCAGAEPVYFLHGVASGDPLQDRVILWTRAQPENGEPVALSWEVAAEEDFTTIVQAGTATALPEKDFIVKVDAGGLTPGRSYFYRFKAGSHVSPTGRTRTLPEGDVSAYKLAAMSCSHYATGYYNVYKVIAEREDIDIALHLGDYIYEYGMDGYGGATGKEIGRFVEPDKEILTLEDYRARYGHYRLDEDLQALHAAKPMIAVWDDHETANNTWKDGAENHSENEGPFRARAAAALQAYLEWLPIRENPQDSEQIYRAFDIGNLARLIMLDTRRIGRSKQLEYSTDIPNRSWPFDVSDPENPIALAPGDVPSGKPIASFEVPFDIRTSPPTPVTDLAYVSTLDPTSLPDGIRYLPDAGRFKEEKLADLDRSILGADQELWLAHTLEASAEKGQVWQVIGQQVVMGRTPAADFSDIIDWSKIPEERKSRFQQMSVLAREGLPVNLDAWDGYPAARTRAYADFAGKGRNVVVLAGDTHASWALNLQGEEGAPVAVEFAAPSVTSPGIEAFVPGDPKKIADAFTAASPDLIWADTAHRGYVLVTLSPQEARGEWFFVDTVKSRDFKVNRAKGFKVTPGTHKLVPLA